MSCDFWNSDWSQVSLQGLCQADQLLVDLMILVMRRDTSQR